MDSAGEINKVVINITTIYSSSFYHKLTFKYKKLWTLHFASPGVEPTSPPRVRWLAQLSSSGGWWEIWIWSKYKIQGNIKYRTMTPLRFSQKCRINFTWWYWDRILPGWFRTDSIRIVSRQYRFDPHLLLISSKCVNWNPWLFAVYEKSMTHIYFMK